MKLEAKLEGRWREPSQLAAAPRVCILCGPRLLSLLSPGQGPGQVASNKHFLHLPADSLASSPKEVSMFSSLETLLFLLLITGQELLRPLPHLYMPGPPSQLPFNESSFFSPLTEAGEKGSQLT